MDTMVETEFQAPTFINFTAANLADDGNIWLQFLDRDGRAYSVDLAKPIIGAVISTIIGLLNKTELTALLDQLDNLTEPHKGPRKH